MTPGPLLAIGGAEDRARRRTVLSAFVEQAGGRDARVAVIATASTFGGLAVDAYREVFGILGVRDVTGLMPQTRAEAAAPDTVAALQRATGIFMTGGNQTKLAAVLAGTPAGEALAAAHAAGAIVAGTSAGASALGAHMVAFGAGGSIPRQRMGHVAAGLGLWPGVLVDQHFSQRNRYGRLLAMVADSPALLGVGLDEDTGALVEGRVLTVLGRGAVTLVDGSAARSDADEVRGARPLMISGVALHVLTQGHRFDLATRALLPRVVPEPLAAASE